MFRCDGLIKRLYYTYPMKILLQLQVAEKHDKVGRICP